MNQQPNDRSPFNKYIKSSYSLQSIEKIQSYLDTLTHDWKPGKSFNQSGYNSDKSFRDCFLSWIDDKYIKDFIFSQFIQANRVGGWNFVIDSMEDLQYTIYHGEQNNHYNWHYDYLPESNKCRKLSLSLMLSQVGEDYEGGMFQQRYFSSSEIVTNDIPLNKGEVIVFPSHMQHRVAPVTSGVRKVIVAWAWGPLFT